MKSELERFEMEIDELDDSNKKLLKENRKLRKENDSLTKLLSKHASNLVNEVHETKMKLTRANATVCDYEEVIQRVRAEYASFRKVSRERELKLIKQGIIERINLDEEVKRIGEKLHEPLPMGD